ncbi:hypothetical protein AAG906_040748 [Vitis piasezkii]
MPWYPQSNGQTKAMNKTLLNSLKKQLEETRVIIPTEIRLPMIRTIVQESEANEGNLEVHLDWADEECEAATILLVFYQ